MLILMPVFGLNQGAQPIIGYNYGAGSPARVRSALRVSLGATVVLCTIAYGLFFAFSRQIIGLFVKDAPQIVELGVTSLRVFLSSIPVVGIAVIGSVYFQAINKGLPALLINAVRQLVVLVPLYLVLPPLLGLAGVWLAGPIADGVSVVLTVCLLVPEMRRLARGDVVRTAAAAS